MNINFTLILQIFNFLIAYFFLAKFLFKPILKLFNLEKEKLIRLNKSVDLERKRLGDKEKLAEENWALCKNYFKENFPETKQLSIATKLDVSSIEQPQELSQKQTKDAINKIISVIKSKVIYD